MTKRTRPAPTRPSSRSLDAKTLRDIRGGVVYQKIEWTWNDGGITAEDDWEART